MKSRTRKRTTRKSTPRRTAAPVMPPISNQLALGWRRMLPELDLVHDFLTKLETHTDGGGKYAGCAFLVADVRYTIQLWLARAAAQVAAEDSAGAK